MQIIAIEEEQDTTGSVIAMVRDAGHNCEVVGDERHFYKRCLGSRRDVAVVDMESPRGQGLGFIKSLASRFPYLHVLAVSANDDDGVVDSVLHAGAKAYLLKPVSQLTIAQVLNRLAGVESAIDS